MYIGRCYDEKTYSSEIEIVFSDNKIQHTHKEYELCTTCISIQPNGQWWFRPVTASLCFNGNLHILDGSTGEEEVIME